MNNLVWYVPLTILPAIGLIILSTSNFLVALNSEIYQLERNNDVGEWIIEQKIKQLRRLGIATALLYSSALLFMFSALSKAIYHGEELFDCLMIIGVIFFTIALSFLFTHATKAISIRQKHLKERFLYKSNKQV